MPLQNSLKKSLNRLFIDPGVALYNLLKSLVALLSVEASNIDETTININGQPMATSDKHVKPKCN